MRPSLASCSALGALLSLCSVAAAEPLSDTPVSDKAPTTEVTYTLEPATVSSYVWRGDRFSADGFDPAFQPFVEVEASRLGPGNLVLGVWTSRMFGPDPGQEIDPYVTYTIEAGFLALKPGYSVYLMPDAEPVDSMHEFSLQTSLVWDFPVAPYVAFAVDPIRADGYYASAGAIHEVELAPVELSTTLNVGASRYAALDYDFSLQDVTLSTRGELPFGESGYYAALVAAGAWSGRAHRVYPYTGVSLGFSR